MICFNCGYRLPDTGADECGLCGMKMPHPCPACKTPNPRYAGYCLSCGQAIEDVAGSEYLTGTGMTSGEILEESRRNVAVLFADVSGFTALSEVLDPEEVRSIINDCFQTITRPVYELEGSIDKYIGDCVMVLFGARQPHADDARRAVSCSLRMQSLMESFSQERLSGRGLQLRISIGIHYGLVVTGRVGNYFDKDYTVMGDTVNLAQRLQTAAPAGTVLVSRSVYEETRERFIFRDMGELTVRNRKEPVGSFRPETECISMEGEQEKLLEREEMLDSIPLLMERLQGGSLVACHITGESGVGKTALAKAMARGIQERMPPDAKVTNVECGTTDRGRPHSLLSALLHAVMNIEGDGNPTAKRYRVVSYCFFLFPRVPDAVVERMADFLGIFIGLERKPDFQDILNVMKPQDLEREMVDQLQFFFRAVLTHRASMIVLDGLQWADDRSITLIEQMLPGLSGIGSIWLFLHRPDKRLEHSPWIAETELNGSHPVFHWTLLPLSEGATARFAAQLTGSVETANEFLSALMRITQGNPLYVREFVTAVKRRGSVSISDGTARLVGSDESEMVKGIGNMILANFQDMPPDTLAMLQTASAIGSSFRLSWMRDLAGLADPEKTMEPALRAGILTVHSVHAGGGSLQKEARFVHDMAREVLYESLLLARRTKLHSNIATYLERNAGKTETELPALLSVQFEKAGDTGRAARYALQTADSYKADYDYASARENWLRFLLLIGFTLPEKVLHDEKEGEPEKGRNNEKVEEEAAPWGDRKTSASLLGADGAALVTGALRALSEQARSEGRGEASLLLLKQALLWVSALKDRLELRLSMADVMRENGLYDQAVSLLADIEPRLGNDTGMHGRLLLSRCTLFRLKMDPGALEAAKSAERILKKVKDYRGLTETMSQMAGIHFSRGEPARAKLVLTRAIGYAERSRDLGAIARISGNLGVLHLAEGDMASARLVFAKAVEMAGKVGNLHSLLSSQINLGILLMEQGRFERAETLLTEVSERAERASLKYQECLAWLNLADLSSEYGQINLARERYIKAETLAGILSLACEGALCQVGRAHVLLLSYDPELDASVDLPVAMVQAGTDSGTVSKVQSDASSGIILNEAAMLLEIALPILKEAGESVGMSDCMRFQAEVAMRKAIAEKVESLHTGFSTSGAVPMQSVTDTTGAANLFSGIGTSPSVHLKEAADLAESALQIATEAGNGMRRVKALRLLGMLDELNGRLKSANERTESSVREAERLESDLEAAKSAFRLSKLHSAAGNAPVASEWLQRARDHAFNVDTCPLRERIMNSV